MPPPASAAADPTGAFEPARVLRGLANVDALLLVLALLYFVVAPGRVGHPAPYAGVLLGYAALVAALRFTPALAARPREKLLLSAAAMVAFITSALAFSGGDQGPLLNLYLLPIITAALALGRGPTVFIVALVLAGRLLISHFATGDDVLGLAFGLTLLTEAVPVLLVAFLTSTLAAGVQDASDRLQAMSDHDDLTGLLNLQAFTRLVEEERQRALRCGNGFAVVLVDIDGLKLLNARHGHEAGDRALAAVAGALRRSSRTVDLVARYGGDEFIMFLSGAGPAVAKVVANRIRHNVGTTTVEIGGALQRVTVSIGAGIFPADGRDLRDLTNAAGRAMQKEKDGRRPLERSEASLRASPSRAVGS